MHVLCLFNKHWKNAHLYRLVTLVCIGYPTRFVSGIQPVQTIHTFVPGWIPGTNHTHICTWYPTGTNVGICTGWSPAPVQISRSFICSRAVPVRPLLFLFLFSIFLLYFSFSVTYSYTKIHNHLFTITQIHNHPFTHNHIHLQSQIRIKIYMNTSIITTIHQQSEEYQEHLRKRRTTCPLCQEGLLPPLHQEAQPAWPRTAARRRARPRREVRPAPLRESPRPGAWGAHELESRHTSRPQPHHGARLAGPALELPPGRPRPRAGARLAGGCASCRPSQLVPLLQIERDVRLRER
jgi:hypothetical protein